MIKSIIKYSGLQNGCNVFIVFIPFVNMYEERNCTTLKDNLLYLKARNDDGKLIDEQMIISMIIEAMKLGNNMLVYFNEDDIPETIFRDIDKVKYLWPSMKKYIEESYAIYS